MSLSPSDFNSASRSNVGGGFVATTSIDELTSENLPIFQITHVRLQFQIASDFVAVQVANNVIVLALASGRLLRIDLYNPQDVDDLDLPKKTSEIGMIRRMFMDPTASHLLISTTQGENFYLHQRSSKVKHLSKLKGVYIESVAWSPVLPTASTREILIGSQNGYVYEVYIEPTDETFRKDERYMKQVYRMADSQAITGLYVDLIPGYSDMRRVILTTATTMLHFVGRVPRHGHNEASSIFSRFFEAETPAHQEFSPAAQSNLSISPESADDNDPERIYAWINGDGVSHGRLFSAPVNSELGNLVLKESRLLPRSAIPGVPKSLSSVALTHYHILVLAGNKIFAVNRLDDNVVFEDVVTADGSKILGLCADPKSSTYWIFTNDSIFEIIVKDEARDVWKIMLEQGSFDAAMRFANTPEQKDIVAIASGDHLASAGRFVEAASIWGKSTKNFEEVCLMFMEKGEHDGLRKYLLTKLASLPKTSIMQRVMVSSWLVEVFMAKLNSLDDTLSTKSEGASGNTANASDLLESAREEYQEFVNKYKIDLDRKTTYDTISSHGREEELLYYASSVNDYNYVLNYWIQREKWEEALKVLKKQMDPEIFYKYASVLISNSAAKTVDILTRQTNLNPKNLIPALLTYDKLARVSISENQAIRYLLFVIDRQGNIDPAVHNALLSIYAGSRWRDETDLLFFLRKHENDPHYDQDFALRVCIKHERVQSCVHIYSSMGQYLQAVELALKHNDIELASVIANRPEDDPALRKKLWLEVAKKVITKSEGIKSALEVLKQCELLKVEDLIPFFPDFVVIDDFKEEICSALEEYSYHIDQLRNEMDDSARTAENIRKDVSLLDRRYAIVEPGERCHVCRYPLLSRQFFVFPCQHAFHTDCLTNEIVKQSGPSIGKRIKNLQLEIQHGDDIMAGVAAGEAQLSRREKAADELDSLIASSCILCSELAVKQIDQPFITDADDRNEWAV